MRILENELKNKAINVHELIKYGFIQENGTYLYKTKICDEQFELTVTVENNKMTSKLFDLANEDEYILCIALITESRYNLMRRYAGINVHWERNMPDVRGKKCGVKKSENTKTGA